eukprot:g1772.t1
MGNLISQETSVADVRSELLDEYRSTDLKTCVECIENLHDWMGATTSCALDFAGFDEVFCIMLGDMEDHFSLFNRPINGQLPNKVDSHEVFCSVILYCKSDSVVNKIDQLVRLFDYDDSGALTKDEMVLLLTTGTRGLCKIAGMACPPLVELEKTAERMFEELDADRNETITTEELVRWLSTDVHVMAYIRKFVGEEDQLSKLCAAQTQFNDNMAAALQEFQEQVKDSGAGTSSNPELPVEKMMEILAERVPHHSWTAAERVTMHTIFDLDGNGMVDFSSFCGVMPSYLGFHASDVDKRGTIDLSELKALLWVVYGMEPSPLTVQSTIKDLDRDQSGEVSLMEWIAYNMTGASDVSNGVPIIQRTQASKLSFSTQVKALYMRADKDGTGDLTASEFYDVLRTVTSSFCAKHLDPDDQKAIEAVDHLSKTVASALMDMLDENRNGRIEFNEFKAHHEDILKALENMLRSAKGAIAEGCDVQRFSRAAF